jgi:hypothetical protein
MKKGNKTIQIFNSYLVAWLSLVGHTFEIGNNRGTVYFEFVLSDDLMSEIKKFQQSPLSRYVDEVKRIRGLIRAYRES